MAQLLAQTVWDRVNTLTASAPFSYTQAREPFSFDLQPSSNVHQTFRVDMHLDESEGVLGYAQAELWRTDIWLARKAQTNPQATYRALLVDINSLYSALVRDYPALDYSVTDDEPAIDVTLPAADADFLVGRLGVRLDFDRAL